MPLPMLRTIRATAIALICLLAGPVLAQSAPVGFGSGAFDNSAPVDVVSDRLDIDQASGRATLTGNVVIVQGDLKLSANIVTVDYTEKDGKRVIERLNAIGEVLIIAGEDAAEGDEAVYTLASSDILMTGDVVVTQNAGTVAGDRLAINLASGAGTVTGRVRTTLQP